MASSGPLGIGAAARLLGTTERALRYYEQLGLIEPPDVTPAGHRRYDEEALRRARRVLALRHLGLPLATVGEVLAGGDLTAVLAAQAIRLDQELAELTALRERIARLLDDPGDPAVEQTFDLLEEIAVKIVLTRIYTRTGDGGTTALAAGTRVDKTVGRLEVMGDVDELVSALGLAVATSAGDPALLRSLQNDLFDLGADVAGSPGADGPTLVDEAYVERLEKACDDTNSRLDPPSSFVLPGATPASAALHQARAICRRAERHAWAAPETPDGVRTYLNRLSDLLFVLARAAETDAEPTWAPGSHRPD